ncbi:DNA methyltransferase [Methylobacterium gnaphalii]|uniref:DNA methyltransferase n=1 Tax=Methylobacterium gnaphalii TaxID=1010610 RepID=UPI001478C94D|nr:DNA methyltransferase [Methylobacterium gnaphalii]GJD70578.1 hypothetical protein MMMDOFMJ_3527 [Methylobacterium gnaphalii]
MSSQIFSHVELAPSSWQQSALQTDCKLHQLAPYIGKLKPNIARHLLSNFTNRGDTILDCFAGSGTIPLEAALLGRKVLAFDSNPYAINLTRAKLEAPRTLILANERLKQTLDASKRRMRYDESQIPEWVRKFFHPETLQNALRFCDECIERSDNFLLACLLSVLHHQRPGFLSYPSSHLVPYLRDRKYSREEFPDMYTERDLEPRLSAKITRTYRDLEPANRDNVITIEQISVEKLKLDREVDAIVTSPPYMNALDYIRDNRLRMWFLDRNTQNYSPEPTDKANRFDDMTAAFADNAFKFLRSGGRCILVVGETVSRKRMTSHPAERLYQRLLKQHPDLRLEHVIQDNIPDVRRSRKSGAATKRELILVLQKAG